MPGKHEINVLVTTCESRTGDAILAEFERKYAQSHVHVTGIIPTDVDLALYLAYKHCTIKQMDIDSPDVLELMSKMDTAILIPPASKYKVDLGKFMVDAAAKAKVENVILLSDTCAARAPEKNAMHHFVVLEEYGYKKLVDIRKAAESSSIYVKFEALSKSAPLLTIWQGASLHAKLHPLCQATPADVRDVALGILAVASSGKEMHPKHRGAVCFQLFNSGTIPLFFDSLNYNPFKVYDCTGPESVSGNDIVNAAKAGGLPKSLKFRDVPEQEVKDYLSKIPGMDPAEVELLLDDFRLTREGKGDFVTDDLQDLIDEKLTTLVAFFNEYKDSFENPE
ncbi:hypothetical protein HK104_000333 [Borealophlyctis nickersoniae]|nr:hypothetical protein HK104_000333 [Borealophlyctis nickersoniae]